MITELIDYPSSNPLQIEPYLLKLMRIPELFFMLKGINYHYNLISPFDNDWKRSKYRI